MIIERAAAKNPVKRISLSGIKAQDLYKAVPHQVLVTPSEESKKDEPYVPMGGFTLDLN